MKTLYLNCIVLQILLISVVTCYPSNPKQKPGYSYNPPENIWDGGVEQEPIINQNKPATGYSYNPPPNVWNDGMEKVPETKVKTERSQKKPAGGYVYNPPQNVWNDGVEQKTEQSESEYFYNPPENISDDGTTTSKPQIVFAPPPSLEISLNLANTLLGK